MQPDPENIPRHESVEHEHPTDVGMLSDDDEHVPGTGVLGDETLVREIPGGLRLLAPSAHDSAAPEPDPVDHEDDTPVMREERGDADHA